MAYKGRFVPKNILKYDGDHTNIVFRSLWERQVMAWADANPDIEQWNSEETVIGYVCRTDGKRHKYYVDFTFHFKNGITLLVEVKPEKETKEPKRPKTNRQPTKRFLNEALTYAKNTSKWEAADNYANKHGYKFQVWTENTLKAIGIKLYSPYQINKKKKQGNVRSS